jgi:hypothetical protein
MCWLSRKTRCDGVNNTNIPKKGECAVAQINGHSRFSRVWDPERSGGFRYFSPCTHYGGFSRNSSFVHPELSKMIGLRGSFRDLTSIKADFLDLLTPLRQTGLSPNEGV